MELSGPSRRPAVRPSERAPDGPEGAAPGRADDRVSADVAEPDRQRPAGDEPTTASTEEAQRSLAVLLDGVRLSPKHRRIAQFLEANPSAAAFHSAGEIASEVGVNAATVVRFAQTLGFRGWPAMQSQLRHHYLASLMPSEVMSARYDNPTHPTFDGALRVDIENLQVALDTIDPRDVEAIARLIHGARETVVVSSGSYAVVGLILSHLGQVMGYRIRLETRGGPELMAALGLLDERDCVIGISFWRVARPVTLALKSSQRRGIPTVGIADSVASPVMTGVDRKLVVPTDGVSFFQSVTAGVSVAYGLLATLQQIGGAHAEESIRRAEELYGDLQILHG